MEGFENGDNLEKIAVIGMAGRFPGASSVKALWKNLCAGRDTITRFTDEDLHPSVARDLRENARYIKARGTIADVENFDERFFTMSPREAEITDPQHRLFLELAWESLEDGGYNPETYEGLIGVYGGAGVNTYFTNNVFAQREKMEAFGEHQTSIANAPDYLTSRASYKFNLRGPSVSVYTGCSLSLVAVCFAFEALQSYQCDMALAGGVYVHCPQNSGYLYQEGEIFSADGFCRPFDAQAQGTVFSNGGGIVLLKRLREAVEDGDNIYAVIGGVALNNDGSNKVSFLAPSVSGQAELIAMAQANAGVHPESITYIEAHGTGTALGDPIEVEALIQAFRLQTAKKQYCALGSIKANIGHLDAAAGVAGLIKTALMLHHKIIPATPHYNSPNPNIDFAESPFYVNSALAPWQTNGAPRRAGVSSFGVGGTNAHVIVEEASVNIDTPSKQPYYVVLLSAKTASALDTMTNRFIEYAKENPSTSLANACYTLQAGRKHFPPRRFTVCSTWKEAIANFGGLDRNVGEARYEDQPEVVFMFSGQGSQYPRMGFELYRTNEDFREAVDRCAEILHPHLGCDLRGIIYADEGDLKEAAKTLQQTRFTQPALFTVEYAVAKLLISLGVRPKAMVGHSIGEYVAAHLAGVFSLEDVLSVVAMRGKLMQDLPQGAMAAIFLPEHEILDMLGEEMSLAAVNAPCLCTVSGEKEALNNLKRTLARKKIDYRDLQTSHAFHSTMVDPVLDTFTRHLEKITLHAPTIPFMSNLTGTWIQEQETIDPLYWRRHLRGAVRFADCIRGLIEPPRKALVEAGPGRTLCAAAGMQIKKDDPHIVIPTLRHPKEKKSDVEFILNTLGRLWVFGIDISWQQLYRHEKRYRVSLPTYPFERRRHWIDCLGAVDASEIRGSVSDADEAVPVNQGVYAGNKKTLRQHVRKEEDFSDVIQEVARIWRDVLGVRDVNPMDNFFDLGGSSVMAAMLFAEIERTFNKRLPLATLYSASTVTQLAQIIQNDGDLSSWSSLVEIQPHGSKPPLFLVHDAGGNVLIYRDLVRHLGDNQPVYGLQSQGLDGVMPYLTRVEDMARHYLNEIRAVHPEGPYLLGGHCLGGAVAYEMAQQLLAQGQNVALLVLLEAYNFSNNPSMTLLRNLHFYAQKVEFLLLNFFLLPPKQKIVFLKEKITKVANLRKRLLLSMVLSRINPRSIYRNSDWLYLSKIWDVNDVAAYQYLPRPYAGNTVQFLPLKEYFHHKGPASGWDDLVIGKLETHKQQVYPGGMLVEPFVGMLAEKLTTCIKQSLQGDTIVKLDRNSATQKHIQQQTL